MKFRFRVVSDHNAHSDWFAVFCMQIILFCCCCLRFQLVTPKLLGHLEPGSYTLAWWMHPSVQPFIASVSPLPNGAPPMLFPMVSRLSTLSSLLYRSFPAELSPSYFPRFPFRSPCPRFHLASSPRNSPQAISHGFPSLRLVVASIRSLPTNVSPSYFPRFPFRPPARHFHLAPSQRSSPRAISHGFLSVQPLVASISLLPNRALPRLFPTISPPSTFSALPARSFPTELSPSYFPRFLSVHPVVASIRSLPTDLSPSYFPRFPLRPPSRHFRIAPSRQVQLNENPSIGDAFGKKTYKWQPKKNWKPLEMKAGLNYWACWILLSFSSPGCPQLLWRRHLLCILEIGDALEDP